MVSRTDGDLYMVEGAGDARAPSWIRDKLLLGMTPGAYLRGLVTPLNLLAVAILAVGVPVMVQRFTRGLAATTHLSQHNPWGLWIAFDVLCGVALAAGGYIVAATVYIFGLKKYHPILRPAVLTGFLGYGLVVVGLLFDVGRPWRLAYPIFVSHGTTSFLFEVAWCVALYCVAVTIEMSPTFCEWIGWDRGRRFFSRLTIGVVVLGLMVSTVHQSSLGSLFLMAPTKLHPLWYTPFLPIYFFISSIVAGTSIMILETTLAARFFDSQIDPQHHLAIDGLTVGLAKASSLLLFTYFFLKLLGVAEGRQWPLLSTPMGRWFLVEMLGFVALPCLLYAYGVRNRRLTLIRVTSAIAVLGIVVNRLNVGMLALNWTEAVRYVPSWRELLISLTLVTIGVLTYRWIVNRMPVLHDLPEYRGAQQAVRR